MIKLISTVILLGCIVAVSYLLFILPNQMKQQTTQGVVPPQSVSDASILMGLATELALKPELRTYNYMDWLDKDSTPFPLKGKQFIVGTTSINGIGKYGRFSQDNLQQVTIANLQPLITSSDDYFIKQGFRKNKMNTRIIENAPTQSAYFGYENGQLKCVVRLDEQTDPFGNFVCGTIDTAQVALQEDFRSVFASSAAESDGMPITSFRVEKKEGTFAIGSASGNVTGYTWIAKKTGDAWNIIWRANEIASCSEMKRLGIPKSIYGNCYEG